MKRATSAQIKIRSGFRISIHALVKRATYGKVGRIFKRHYFNPRPREEGDLLWHVRISFEFNFNPRPREEGDKKPFPLS